MPAISFDRLLSAPQFTSPVKAQDAIIVRGQRQVSRPDTEKLEGEFGRKPPRMMGGSKGGQPPSRRLGRLMKQHQPASRFAGGISSDLRQQAVVKIHFYNHGVGAGGALKAHAKYLTRDAAQPEDREMPVPDWERSDGRDAAAEQSRAHADYLARGEREHAPFYDRSEEGVDGAARLEAWAKSDKRHFRIVLSVEEGEHIRDLPAFTREVMARAEAHLDTELSWVAVDHHDTAHVHTHLIVRGRRANGQDLIIPKDFIKHGLRNIARDIATEWLGHRTPDQERDALNRLITRHAPTPLDRVIDVHLGENRTLRISRLEALDGNRSVTKALKARAKELERMGLASEVKRGVLAFEADWQERLKAMELHLDIRKRLIQERQAERQQRLLDRARNASLGLAR